MVRLKLYNILNIFENNWKSQFHYGSIKTQQQVELIKQAFGLNSTMVRLKPPSHSGHIASDLLSQFHYGSIKTYKHNSSDTGLRLSQFHYGSIKTHRCSSWFYQGDSLNSTMVRLKQSLTDWNFCNWGKSQFHYGSIKTLTWKQEILHILSLSQFHYGSIKTQKSLSSRALTKESQFHYGSIKTDLIQVGARYNITEVSIPLWFD